MPYRFAAYGFVSRDAGSVATADHNLLAELLRRGHRVDLYMITGFRQGDELVGTPGFRQLPVAVGWLAPFWWVVMRLPSRVSQAGRAALSLVSNTLHYRKIARQIRQEHRNEPYDAFLSLGLMAPSAVRGVPVVSWPQDTPEGEWDALRRLKEQVLRLSGRMLYESLRVYYTIRRWMARIGMKRSDRLLSPTHWSAERWREFGMPAHALHVVAYPFDASKFPPVPRPESRRPFRFLWLGRIVPRKRLDLALEAVRQLRERGEDVELLIIGRVTYCAGYQDMIDEAVARGGVEYRAFIPQTELPELFRSLHAILQPSENEVLGNTVIEGLCSGLPAVIGPTNGTVDYAGDSVELFERYEPEAVAEAMLRLKKRVDADAQGIAERGRAAVLEKVATGRIADQFEGIIADLVGRPPRAAEPGRRDAVVSQSDENVAMAGRMGGE